MPGYGVNDVQETSGGYSPNDVPADQKKPEKSGALRRIADVGVSLGKGVASIPELAVGLADIPTGGRVGKSLQEAGVDFKGIQRSISDLYSPEQQEANRKVQEAKGFGGTIKAAFENPSTIVGAVAESAPLLIPGMGVARGLGGVTKLSGLVRGATGEGVTSAGLAAERTRQETDDGTLSAKQALSAVGLGVGTAAFGAAGGKIAQKLGIGDIDTFLAGKQAAPAIKQGFMRRIGGGALAEGAFEELPQSAQEQIWQNYALGKPLMEGVPESGAMGLLAGGAMGGGFSALNRGQEVQPPDSQQNAQSASTLPITPTIEAGFSPEEVESFRADQAANQARMQRDLDIQRGMGEVNAGNDILPVEEVTIDPVDQYDVEFGEDITAQPVPSEIARQQFVNNLPPPSYLEWAQNMDIADFISGFPIRSADRSMTLASILRGPFADHVKEQAAERLWSLGQQSRIPTPESLPSDAGPIAKAAAMGTVTGAVQTNQYGMHVQPDMPQKGLRDGATNQGGEVSPMVAQGDQSQGANLPGSGSVAQPDLSSGLAGRSGGTGIPGATDGSAVSVGDAGVQGVASESITPATTLPESAPAQVTQLAQPTIGSESEKPVTSAPSQIKPITGQPTQPGKSITQRGENIVVLGYPREALENARSKLHANAVIDQKGQAIFRAGTDMNALKEALNPGTAYIPEASALKAEDFPMYVKGGKFSQARAHTFAKKFGAKSFDNKQEADTYAEALRNGEGGNWVAKKHLGKWRAVAGESNAQDAGKTEAYEAEAIDDQGVYGGKGQPEAMGESESAMGPAVPASATESASQGVAQTKKVSNNLIRRIQQLGGINTRYLRDVTGEDNARRFSPGLFRERKQGKGGTIQGYGLDELANILSAEGFPINLSDDTDIDGVNQLTGLIQSAINGRIVLNHAGLSKSMQDDGMASRREALKEEIENLGGTYARNASTKRLEGAVAALRAKASILEQELPLEAAALSDSMGDELVARTVTGNEAMLALGFTEEEINEINANYRKNQETTKGATEEGNGTGATEGKDQGFGLTGETEEEVRAKEAARISKEKAEADRIKADEQPFIMTGSHRPADELAARGQQYIFDSSPTPAQKAPDSAERYEAGSKLTKEERKSTLKTLTDVYRSKHADKEERIAANGESYFAYPHQPELFEKSDITGKMVRFYVTLPDGRIAHPTELFPDYSQADVDRAIAEQVGEARVADENKKYRLETLNRRMADSLAEANRIFNKENPARADYVPAILTNGKQFIRTAPDNVAKDVELLGGDWNVQPAATTEATPAVNQKVTTEPVAKIEDFGDKIGGSRKDMAKAMRKEWSDDEIGQNPLSKIWPKSEVDAIEDKFIAAFAHAARDEVPSKPRKAYLVKGWVEKVKMLRGLASKALDGKITKDRFVDLLDASAGLKHFASRVRLLEAIDRAHWGRIGKVEEYPDAFTYDADGKQEPRPQVSVEIDDRRNRFQAKTLDDALPSILEKLGAKTQEKAMQFEVRGRVGRYAINKKGDPLYRKLSQNFDTSKDAFDYIKTNYSDLVAGWENVKESDNVKETDVRSGENRPRHAKDWRGGKDATQQQFQDSFGFRGVEWGNWVSQGKNDKERQGMLNQAYDALMDLSDIIGIPPKAISLNGSLGLGFGSRGHGWASAHFEPDTLVVNLTKTRGAGSLGHEWFHALDNYFQLKRGKPASAKQEDWFVTYAPENYYVHKASGQKIPARAFEKMISGESVDGRHLLPRYRNPEQWELKEGVRPEVGEAFADLVNALNDSPMAKRASLIDKGKSGGYWSRIIERGARSFENYLIHKMGLDGYHNDYLANVRRIEDFGRDHGRYPYLLDSEIEPVAKAFDNLFATVQTKETDQGVVMFSRRIHGNNPNAHDYIVPETPEFADNMSGDLAYTPRGAEANGFEQLPIRLTVGVAREAHRGFGIMHMADNAKRDTFRKPPQVTDDEAENFARQVAAVARTFQSVYHEHGNRYILVSPKTTDALAVERTTDAFTGEEFYSAVTLVPAKNRHKWGKPVWAGRVDFPVDRALQPRASVPSSDKETQQSDRQPQRNQTSHFDFSKIEEDRQPRKVPVTVKKRRAYTAKDEKFSRRPAFFSPLSKAIESAKQETIPAAQWKLWIQGNKAKLGLKDDELNFSGVLDYLELRGKDKVTKGEIAEYLSGNGVTVHDVVKGDVPPMSLADERRFNELMSVPRDERSADDIEWMESLRESATDNNKPKFSGYWESSYKGGIPGTYREILVTLPVKTKANAARAEYEEWAHKKGYSANSTFAEEKYKQETGNAAPPPRTMSEMDADRSANFKSSHWNEKNVLVHVRLDEVTGADGKRYVRVGEIQSDWGQAGKRDGFAEGETARIKGEARVSVPAKENPSPAWGDLESKDEWAVYWEDGSFSGGYNEESAKRVAAAGKSNAKSGVPSAPFVTDTKAWVALGIKRALIHSIDVGADGVVFGTGQQNADLYDLSKQVESIRLEGDFDQDIEVSVIQKGSKTGYEHIKTTDKDGLADVIGKELAERAINGGQREFHGLDLAVGGTGMKAFYDSIVPSVANKVLRKVAPGSKVVSIETEGGKQPGFAITQDTRDKLLAHGVPLFAREDKPTSSTTAYTEPADKADVAAVDKLNQTLRNYFGSDDYGVVLQPGRNAGLSHADQEAIRAAFRTRVIQVVSKPGGRDAFNGFSIPGVDAIFVNANTDIGFINIAGHELLHDLKRRSPTLYAYYGENAKRYIKNLPAYQARLNAKLQSGEPLYDSESALEELLADFMGDSLSDPAFLQQMADRNPSKFKQFVNAVRLWLSGVASKLRGLGSSQHISDVKALQKYLADVLDAYAEGKEIAGVSAPKFQRVYHGTPHIWAPEPGFPHGRPRLDKMGTGEGAQAYGWGVYLAQSRDTGAYYLDSLKEGVYGAMKRVMAEEGLSGVLHEKMFKYLFYDKYEPKVAAFLLKDASPRAAEKYSVAELTAIAEKTLSASPKEGSLYQLDIPDATLPYLLDWDRPLSEQTKEVRDALAKDDYLTRMPQSISGADAYALLSAKAKPGVDYALQLRGVGGQKAASEYLASLGIVGNRYLDGQSRNRPLKDIKREFLEELPEDAGFAEVTDLIGTGSFSPKNNAMLAALRDDDWLGFDYPAQAISAALSNDLNGYDASPALLRAVEDAKEGATFNFVIWHQPTLDKIAMLERNGEKLDAMRDAEVRFSRKNPKRFNLEPETSVGEIQRKLQDNANVIKEVQNAIKLQGGKVTVSEDVYHAMERMTDTAAWRMETFVKETVEPLMKRAAAIKTNTEEIGTYLMALGAKDRNAYISTIRQDMPNNGSGMEDSEAQTIVDDYKQRPDFAEFDKLARDFQEITERKLNLLIDGGVITEDQAAEMKDAFGFYVPYKGFETVDEAGDFVGGNGIGSGYSTSKRMSKRAYGRISRASDVVENIIRDYNGAIFLAEKAKVGETLERLVDANPDSTLWTKDTAKSPTLGHTPTKYEIQYKGKKSLTMNSLADAKKFIGNQKNKGDFTIQRIGGDPKVQYRDLGFDNTKEVRFIRYGKDVRIQIHHPLFIAAYNKLNNAQLNAFLEASSSLNSFLRQMYTQKNPVFIFKNAMRDVQTGYMVLTGEQGNEFANKSMLRVPKSFKNLLSYAKKGTTGNAVEDAWYKKMREWGGGNSFAYMEDVEAQKLKLEELLAKHGGDGIVAEWKKSWATQSNVLTKVIKSTTNASKLALYRLLDTEVLRAIENVNMSVENAIRLSAFREYAERNGGLNASNEVFAEASRIAKNVTVNFNRKGEFTPVMNSLYLFWNANVQGTQNIYRSATDTTHKKQVQAIMAGLATMGFLMGMATGDDDDELSSEFDKHHNALIHAGDSVWKIPLAYGLGFFFGAGYTLGNLVRGRRTYGEATLELAGMALEHFSPLGTPIHDNDVDVKDVAVMASPTIFKPLTMSAVNKNTFGTALVPHYSETDKKPDSETMYRATRGTLYDQAANNVLTKWADVSPETLKMLTNYMTGGVGGIVADSVGIVANQAIYMMNGVDLDEGFDVEKLPVIKSFHSVQDVEEKRGRFYKQLEDADDKLSTKSFVDDKGRKHKGREARIRGRSLSGWRRSMAELRDAERDARNAREFDKARRIEEEQVRLAESLDKSTR